MSRAVRRAMVAHPELADLIGREFRRSGPSLRANVEIIARLRAGGVPETYALPSPASEGRSSSRHKRRSASSPDEDPRLAALSAAVDPSWNFPAPSVWPKSRTWPSEAAS